MPAKAPSAPSVTARRSLSLPTQHITKSCPCAAALGVTAVLPPNFSAHALALVAVRLKPVTSWPPFFTRCPAIGKPITPRPRKATLAMCATLLFAGGSLGNAGGQLDQDRLSALLRRAHHTACAAEGNAFVGWQAAVLC